MKRQSVFVSGNRRRQPHELIVVLVLTILFVLIGILLIKNSTAQPVNNGALLQDLKPEKSGYELGSSVTIQFGIQNTGKQPITYKFPSSKVYDLWITRADKEVYRLSKCRAYAMVITALTLQPCETRTFDTLWNQKDNDGNAVGPGTYYVYAQLTPSENQPPPASSTIQIGTRGAVVVPLSVQDAIQHAERFEGRTVHIIATYRGWQPNSNDSNVQGGPPVSRDDWAICDSTACMYVHGNIGLDPVKDLDTKVDLMGKLVKTTKGQVYLDMETGKVVKSQP